MKKVLVIMLFSVAALQGFSQKVERTEVGEALVYTISEHANGRNFTNGYLKESLLYKKGLTYCDCIFEGNAAALKNDLLKQIELVIPNFKEKLSRSNVAAYVVLLPTIDGCVKDASVGWNSNFKGLFSEKELEAIIGAAKSIALKVSCDSLKSGLKYCYPFTITYFPN